MTLAKKWANNKKSTILVQQSETKATLPNHGLVILTKFHYNLAKIVDYLLQAILQLGSFFSLQSLCIHIGMQYFICKVSLLVALRLSKLDFCNVNLVVFFRMIQTLLSSLVSIPRLLAIVQSVNDTRVKSFLLSCSTIVVVISWEKDLRGMIC